MASDTPLIVIASNRAYLPWTRLLLASLADTHPGFPAVLCGVNLRRAQVRSLLNRYPRLQFEAVTVEETGFLPDPAVANARPYWYRAVMGAYQAPVYWFMDADLLVRRRLDGLRHLLQGRDAALVFRYRGWRDVPLRVRTCAGLLALRPAARRLLDHWIGVMEESGPLEGVRPGEWFWEQSCLALAARRTRLSYARIPAHEYLNTFPFDPAARIWSANVERRLKGRVRRLFARELAARRARTR